MQLYSYKIGGEEYFSTTYEENPDGSREPTPAGIVFRTDGDNIFIYASNIWKQGFKIALVGNFRNAEEPH